MYAHYGLLEIAFQLHLLIFFITITLHLGVGGGLCVVVHGTVTPDRKKRSSSPEWVLVFSSI